MLWEFSVIHHRPEMVETSDCKNVIRTDPGSSKRHKCKMISLAMTVKTVYGY